MSAETKGRTSTAKELTPGEREQLGIGGSGVSGGGSTTAMVAITQRELASLFFSPIAYLVGFIFLAIVTYLFFANTLVAGAEASMRGLLDRMAMLLVFALPILTMRSIADEFASGSIETLMTAPVTDAAVVMGKFCGALLFFVVLLATTFVHWMLMSLVADPMFGAVLTGYVGMVLLGSLFIAIGIFASCCTRYQLLSAVVSVGILAILTFLADYGAEYAGRMWLRSFCSYLNVLGHYSDFSKGILDTRSVIFFVTGTAFFLLLATKVLESRRWR